ncbi:HAD-IA family hydrolase [Candidatus Roizmanbacteria bacterium]|nr:HAD-IA family hydrolase [Candidatus Roizmanbacteria bacterium]
MISFIYFDLGGVVELDYSGTNKWEEMRRDLGVTKEQDASYESVWNRYQSKICLDCDVDTLIPMLEKEVGVKFPEGYSVLEDFVNRFEKNPSMWPFLEEVKKKYRIGLLTNMYPRMFSLIKRRGLMPPVEWDVIIDSSVVGLQKPDPKIYELAEHLADVKGEQILFVENTKGHIEAVKQFGWSTFLYDPQKPEESMNKLTKILID